MNNPYITKPLEIIRKPAVSSKPFYMQIEATTHCNLACKMYTLLLTHTHIKLLGRCL
jgi:MoaA/NifB/PqqE/SkfB family radical SAM enzyme